MTILFLDDWKKEEYKSFIVDTQTKNKSFIRYASLLKSMGIANHAFPLQLPFAELQGVDPYDPNLTLEQIALISLACKQSSIYFFRECLRVPGGASDDPIQFNANRGNMALYWLFFNHITTILIQIRQTGKSFSSDCLMTYLLNIACTDTTINLLTKDDTLRSANLERLRDIERELPFFLKMRKKGDIGNTEEMHVSRLRNKYKGHLPNKSPKMALNVGRGMTSPIIQADETAFFYNIAISLPAALAACTAARQLAKRKGQPYGIIMTTTAGKKDDRDGRYVYNMVQEAATWTEKFFDCANIEELELLIRKSSKTDDLLVNCTFNHRQLGYTDEWLKDAVRTARAVGEDAERDFGNVWTSGSRSSPLPVSISDMIRASEVSEHYAQICSPGAYIVRWYIAEEDIPARMASDFIIVALDSSDGAGGDDLGLVFKSVKTGEVLAVADINETNLITFCEYLCGLLSITENILLIPERRSTGAMIIDYLLIMLPQKGIDPFKVIYNKVVQEKDEYPERFALINKPMYARDRNIYVDLKKYFGFATSAVGATSRSDLYSNTLISAAKMTGDKVKDPKLINQILGLVVRNGRVDHEEGGHDDLCFIGSTLVRTVTGNRPIKDLKVGDLVLTRQGYKPIVKLFCSEKEVITKYGLTGTPNHPFITPDGEVEFKDLNLNSKVYVCCEKQSIIMEKTIIDILNHQDHNLDTTIIDMISGKNLRSLFIDKYMKITMDLFQKVIKFITEMVTLKITRLRISNVSLCLNTAGNTRPHKRLEKNTLDSARNVIPLENGVKRTQNLLGKCLSKMGKNHLDFLIGEQINPMKSTNTLSEQVNYRLNLEQKKELILLSILKNGDVKILNWLRKCLDKMDLKTHLLKSGVKRIQEKLQTCLPDGKKQIRSSLVKYIQKPLKKQQKKEERKELVYNIMVADCHEYFVNDILVHNCIAFLLSHWVLINGKHLSFYGINSRDILVNNRASQELNDPIVLYENRYQEKLREHIKKLMKEIEHESDEYVSRRLEAQLIHYSKQLTDNDRAILSVDELLTKAREHRQQKYRYN